MRTETKRFIGLVAVMIANLILTMLVVVIVSGNIGVVLFGLYCDPLKSFIVSSVVGLFVFTFLMARSQWKERGIKNADV